MLLLLTLEQSWSLQALDQDARNRFGEVSEPSSDIVASAESEACREGLGHGNARTPSWMQGPHPTIEDDRYGKGPNAWKDPLNTLPGE